MTNGLDIENTSITERERDQCSIDFTSNEEMTPDPDPDQDVDRDVDGDIEAVTEAVATGWLSQIDLPGSLQAYGGTRLAEAFAGQGSAAEHLSQTLCCSAEDFSHAALQILVDQCQNSRSGSGVLMQGFTRQLKLRQIR